MVCVLHKHLPNWIHEASLCVCKGQVDTGSMHALIETCGECLVLSSTQIVVTAGASSWYELKSTRLPYTLKHIYGIHMLLRHNTNA